MTENYLVVAMLAVVAFGLMFFWLVYRDRHHDLLVDPVCPGGSRCR